MESWLHSNSWGGSSRIVWGLDTDKSMNVKSMNFSAESPNLKIILNIIILKRLSWKSSAFYWYIHKYLLGLVGIVEIYEAVYWLYSWSSPHDFTNRQAADTKSDQSVSCTTAGTQSILSYRSLILSYRSLVDNSWPLFEWSGIWWLWYRQSLGLRIKKQPSVSLFVK